MLFLAKLQLDHAVVSILKLPNTSPFINALSRFRSIGRKVKDFYVERRKISPTEPGNSKNCENMKLKTPNCYQFLLVYICPKN